MTVSITYKDVELEVEGDYTAPVAGTRYLRNGDPGDPPEGAEFDLEAVYVEGVDIIELLDSNALAAIAELACDEAPETIEDRIADDAYDRWKDERWMEDDK